MNRETIELDTKSIECHFITSDIKAFGFNLKPNKHIAYYQEFEKDGYLLRYIIKTNKIIIIKSELDWYTEHETVLFSGEIQTVEELVVILKAVGIIIKDN